MIGKPVVAAETGDRLGSVSDALGRAAEHIRIGRDAVVIPEGALESSDNGNAP